MQIAVQSRIFYLWLHFVPYKVFLHFLKFISCCMWDFFAVMYPELFLADLCDTKCSPQAAGGFSVPL